jgi:hypothetical protein
LPAFIVVVPKVNAVVPKSNNLNQLPDVIVGAVDPDPVNVKLGLLVAVPPVVPKVYVLDASAAAVNPPAPVQVKFVVVAADSTVPVAVNKILFDPKSILRTLVLDEVRLPVVKLYPFNDRVPDVKVVAVAVTAADSVEVPLPTIFNELIVAPLVVIEPESIDNVKPVYTPVADRIKLLTVTLADTGVIVVVPKFNVLK